jgi:hypothetical protein
VADPWAAGAAKYLIDEQAGENAYIVGVRCSLGSLPGDELVLLDTGAMWTVIGSSHVDLLASDLGEDIEPIRMSTRLGSVSGNLRRLTITLVADIGASLEIDATVAVCPSWTGPIVLGYHGLMERVCLVLDPGTDPGQAWFYFGRPGKLLPPQHRLLEIVD